MKTALLTVKIDPKVKRKAHSVAEALGMSLGTLVSIQLNEFIRTKTVYASLGEERLSKYAVRELKKSEADIKAGRVYSFNEPANALKFLDTIITKKRSHAD